MRLSRPARIVVLPLLALVLFCFWYWEAEDYSPRAMSGNYAFRSQQEKSELILKPDYTFQQELDSAGSVRHAKGTWWITGRGHITFSQEFLTLSGEEPCYEEPACGMIRNNFGYVSFTLGLTPDEGPAFHKKLFR